MKKTPFFILILLSFLLEIVLCYSLYQRVTFAEQDPVAINRCRMSVADHFGEESFYDRSLDYVLLDTTGQVLFKTKEGLAENISAAVRNSDTILTIEKDGTLQGTILIRNTVTDKIRTFKTQIILVIIVCAFIQITLILSYFLYLKKRITDPFHQLSGFAVRVAGGNLDIPLDVDRKHVFGEFTEAFDLMRNELKKARAAEKKAVDEKKELVAKLSHDIKTPVASIKSTSEIGYEVTKEEKTKDFFNLINVKSDQITVLVDNLFNASVQDVTEIAVNPSEHDSSVLADLIANADYLRKSLPFTIPSCRVFIDKLRMQQVFDNLFVNSYKYADTEIKVEATLQDTYLVISITDKGPGVSGQELPLLKEKYKRGANASDKDGAGLGLFLTDYFLKSMDGRMQIRNAEPGFSVSLYIRTV